MKTYCVWNTVMSKQCYFAHRERTNGTVDSICLQCYVTVANVEQEENLASLETIHNCVFRLEPWVLTPTGIVQH